MSDEFLGEIMLDSSPIPAECPRRLDEITVRRDGCVWRIHRNDADPFPSNPHAHNLESGLKLDLSNGRLYSGTQFTNTSIAKKHLFAIREQAESKGLPLPPLTV